MTRGTIIDSILLLISNNVLNRTDNTHTHNDTSTVSLLLHAVQQCVV